MPIGRTRPARVTRRRRASSTPAREGCPSVRGTCCERRRLLSLGGPFSRRQWRDASHTARSRDPLRPITPRQLGGQDASREGHCGVEEPTRNQHRTLSRPSDASARPSVGCTHGETLLRAHVSSPVTMTLQLRSLAGRMRSGSVHALLRPDRSRRRGARQAFESSGAGRSCRCPGVRRLG